MAAEAVAGTAAGTAQWIRCGQCTGLVYGRRLARNLNVCPECGHHRRLTADERIGQLADEGSFEELAGDLPFADVLGFTDSRPYPDRLDGARAATGLAEAVRCGTARIGGHPAVLAVMDFRFMGGSLGVGVGELVTRAAEAALDRRIPLIIVTASGGARMQEGVLSLMQMAKTSQAIGRMREAGVLSVSVITDPTYGGVAASYATNTDVLVAETGARMGFAGPRVIQQTIRQVLPDGFQRAEFLLEHGQIDLVEERRNLRGCLRRLLAAAHAQPPTAAAAPPRGFSTAHLVTDPDELPGRDAWDAVRAARDPGRPTTLDYISLMFDAFVELHGDRLHGDCPAIVAGLAELAGGWVAVVGHQKGHTTRELAARNFGMPQPEGYRKALRVMRLAAALGLPVVTLVDTPGANPGLEAEERGQALAISDSVLGMAGLRTPVVSVVTGEGGSGGALALAVADRVLAMENSVYSVISPEGCSAILWNDAAQAPAAARALRLTAPDLLRLGVVDGVLREPAGGAQTDHDTTAQRLRGALLDLLPGLCRTDPGELVERRRARLRRFGAPARAAGSTP